MAFGKGGYAGALYCGGGGSGGGRGEGGELWPVFTVPGALRGRSSLGELTRIEALEQPDQKEGSRQALFILTLLPG